MTRKRIVRSILLFLIVVVASFPPILCVSILLFYPTPDIRESAIFLSPNGHYVAASVWLGRGDDEIYIIDVSGDHYEFILRQLDGVFQRWLPDSQYFLVEQLGKDEVFPTSLSGEVLHLEQEQIFLNDNRGNRNSFQWSPNAAEVIFLSYLNGVNRLYSAQLDTLEVRKLSDRPVLSAVSWSPNGVFVAFISPAEKLLIDQLITVNVETLETNLLLESSNAITNLSWSPDGSQIAFLLHDAINDPHQQEQEIHIVDVQDRQDISLGSLVGSPQLYWSPNNEYIAFYQDSNLVIKGINGNSNVTENCCLGRPSLTWSEDSLSIKTVLFTGRKVLDLLNPNLLLIGRIPVP